MSEFVMAMGPLVLIWSVPLLPMVYTGIVATIETVSAAELWRREAPARATAVPSEVTA